MFAEVIIDISHADVDRFFTYAIPEDLPVIPGMHVLVPFGRGNTPKEGFVTCVKETCQVAGTIKAILRILEPYPVLTKEQLELAAWIQSSYNCLAVDALRLMIPSQLRGGKVKEKSERTVCIAPELDVAKAESSFLSQSGKVSAPRQYELFHFLLDSKGEFSTAALAAHFPNCSASIQALLKKGYIVEKHHVTFRTPSSGLSYADTDFIPTASQQNAIIAICNAVSGSNGCTFLLHGVTGSGKTEVYLRSIETCIKEKKQAIMLVPEISLTPQTVGRFRARFGDSIAVLHSGLSAGERFDEWRRIRLGLANVIIGARSAIFAPVENLGLIIIDEEHEGSYQSETVPRYHATEIALHRSVANGAPVVLGSATPSIQSYFRARNGRYHLLELPERVMHRNMPTVELVDMRAEFLSGNNSIFSSRLLQLTKECLQEGHQAMFFLNRRGYSTFVSCRACGNVIQCDNCDIPMTYHKTEDVLKCHYCGSVKRLPGSCPLCGKPFMKYFGIGTEQVEEQLHQAFPDARSIRMDTDTMRSKDSYTEMLSDFGSGKADILIGTQMIAKGHDFPNVTLVGVIAADSSLCIPDYRSTERTYQLLEQVSGRAGRDEVPGRVVIQTYMPEHPVIRQAQKHDYGAFFQHEIMERRKGLFPPYSLFLRILFTGPDSDAVAAACTDFSAQLKTEIVECLGKEGRQDLLMLLSSPAPIHKKQGIFRHQILIKLLRTNRTAAVIRLVYRFITAHRQEQFAILEVNPQELF